MTTKTTTITITDTSTLRAARRAVAMRLGHLPQIETLTKKVGKGIPGFVATLSSRVAYFLPMSVMEALIQEEKKDKEKKDKAIGRAKKAARGGGQGGKGKEEFAAPTGTSKAVAITAATAVVATPKVATNKRVAKHPYAPLH